MAKSRRRPNRVLRERAPRSELMHAVRREDGEALTPRVIAIALGDQLAFISAHRDERDYKSLCIRLTMQEFNWMRDQPWNSGMDDHYRESIAEAGKDEGIVIGIGDNVVIVTHDDN